jgi:hypothetical protein
MPGVARVDHRTKCVSLVAISLSQNFETRKCISAFVVVEDFRLPWIQRLSFCFVVSARTCLRTSIKSFLGMFAKKLQKCAYCLRHVCLIFLLYLSVSPYITSENPLN